VIDENAGSIVWKRSLEPTAACRDMRDVELLVSIERPKIVREVAVSRDLRDAR